MITCFIIDDEPIARSGLKEYLSKIGDFLLIGEGENISQLNFMLQHNTPDVIFLDIEMPYKSGIQWLRSAVDTPLVVITSAYEQYAIQGYDFNVIDYLLKPFSYSRFEKAIEKVRSRLSNNTLHEYMYMSTNKSKHQKIFFKDIAYIEANQNYCRISLSNKTSLLVRSTLTSLIEILPVNQFIRVHRSYVVNTSMINSVDMNKLLINDTEISLSASYKKELINILSQQ